ncbi:hypothetical protein ACL02T_33085 [Pseudonocardia sp. RS010]|uniref:hypothetical protein n=1 Tax=Pseudonocardia sp. RS010 TaxID=3385979 RepID=UPI0039A35E1F
MSLSTTSEHTLADDDQDIAIHSANVGTITGLADPTTTTWKVNRELLDADATTPPALAAEDGDALADVFLHAFYGNRGGPLTELSHVDLVKLAAAPPYHDTFAHQLAQRREQAAAGIAAIYPLLAGAIRQTVLDELEAAQIAGTQLIATDTLRRWGVNLDAVADHAAERRKLAATGARHLADEIRREIAHPLDDPDTAADVYRDASIFDAEREDPAAAAAFADDAVLVRGSEGQA